jgi:DNA-directed RNA polymerase subunit RPC12/RpoP
MFFFGKRLKVIKLCLPDLKGGANMSEKRGEELGIVYECVKCGAKVSLEELDLRGGGVKCTYCGYRVLRKVRPPVVKRVKTK